MSIVYHIEPVTNLKGEWIAPGDKSISHRALMLAAIAEGTCEIHDLLMGADNLATMVSLQAMGVKIERLSENRLMVEGVGLHGLSKPKAPLDCGNSGTAMRLFAGMLSGQKFTTTLMGDQSLMRRPMGRVVEPLRMMGATINMSEKKTAPLTIHGEQTLHGIEYRLPVASAQVKSALILAGLYADGDTIILEPEPTRDHTERMLQTLGYPIIVEEKKIKLRGNGKLRAQQIEVPGDISSAAFFMVAATIVPHSHLILRHVGINPTRIGIIHILKKMGANIEIVNEKKMGNEPIADLVVRSAALKGITIPTELVPLAIDEFPVLCIAAACAQGQTTIRGAEELRVKETDRIAAMEDGLIKLGIQVETQPDGMIIHGGKLQGGTVDSFDDHRIAMAFSIAGCVANSPVKVLNCDQVMTSFPNFVVSGQRIGMNIRD